MRRPRFCAELPIPLPPVFGGGFGLGGGSGPAGTFINFQGSCGDSSKITTDYSVTLAGCWTDARISDVETAFSLVDGRTSLAFVDIFAGLTFGFDPNVDYGITRGSTLVEWNATQIAASSSQDFQEAVVHELGHVLENRTSHLQDSMFNTARGRAVDGSLSTNVRVPSRDRVATMAAIGRGEDETKETIADYFMFWVYQAFKQDTLGLAAQVYMEGGLIIHDRNLPRTNPDAYPFVVSKDETGLAQGLLAAVVVARIGDTAVIIDSPGINYWLSNASP